MMSALQVTRISKAKQPRRRSGGALLWWFFITYAVSKLRVHFDVRGIRIINRVIGAVVMVGSLIGIILISTGVWSLH